MTSGFMTARDDWVNHIGLSGDEHRYQLVINHPVYVYLNMDGGQFTTSDMQTMDEQQVYQRLQYAIRERENSQNGKHN
jgi:hypothetical protein